MKHRERSNSCAGFLVDFKIQSITWFDIHREFCYYQCYMKQWDTFWRKRTHLHKRMSRQKQNTSHPVQMAIHAYIQSVYDGWIKPVCSMRCSVSEEGRTPGEGLPGCSWCWPRRRAAGPAAADGRSRTPAARTSPWSLSLNLFVVEHARNVIHKGL